MEYQRGSLRKHEELKQRILDNPTLIGINKDHVISVETEYPIRRRKSVTAQPDIVIKHRDRQGISTTFIEVKSSNCRRALTNLERQLRKISNFIRREHLAAQVIGVYPEGSTLTTIPHQ